MKVKRYISCISMMLCWVLAQSQPKKSPYEGYGYKKDSMRQIELALEYWLAYDRLDTALFGRLITEAETEDAVMEFWFNDSFEFYGRKPLDKNDSALIRKWFDEVNLEMDGGWSMHTLRKKNPNKVVYPMYKYVFKRIIEPGYEIRKNPIDSLHIYWYDAINFSKVENFCGKTAYWYQQLYPAKNVPSGMVMSGVKMVKPLSYFKVDDAPAPIRIGKNTYRVKYLKVPGRVFTLRIRDYVIQDGDIIDIYLNNTLMHKHVTITSDTMSFSFPHLDPHTQYDLKIIVISEGMYAPCTVKGYIWETKEKFSIFGSLKEDLHLYILTGP